MRTVRRPFPFLVSIVATLTGRAESGVIIESEFMLVDSNDTPYARLFVRFARVPSHLVLGANAMYCLPSPRPSI